MPGVPAPLGPLVGFSIGVLLAWSGWSRRKVEAAPWPSWSRDDRLIALFATLVFAPICAYFIVFAADWSLAYVVDSRAIPSAIGLLLVVTDAISVMAGAEIARRLARRGALSVAAALASAALAPALLFALLFRARLAIEGTFHQVHSDFGTLPVAGGPLGYALLWMALLLAAGLALTVRLLRADPRPPPSPTAHVVDAPASVFHA